MNIGFWEIIYKQDELFMFSEHCADESYEIWVNKNDATYSCIKDGEVIVFPTLSDLIGKIFFGSHVECFYCSEEEQTSILFKTNNYNYYNLKKICDDLR